VTTAGRARASGGRRAGLSVVEVLVAAAICAGLASAIAVLFATSHAGFLQAEARADLQQNGRVALNEIVRLLRMAGSDPLETGRFGFRDQPVAGPGRPRLFVAEASASRLAFTLDANGDGVLQASDDEIVGFELDPACAGPPCTLRRLGAGPPQPLAERVLALRFRYFDARQEPLPNPPAAEAALTPAERDAIRRVRVELTVDAPAPDGSERFPLSSDVALRPRLR
jgi:hypothetical protein